MSFSLSTSIFAAELSENGTQQLKSISFTEENKNINSYSVNDINDCKTAKINKFNALNAIKKSKNYLKKQKVNNNNMKITTSSYENYSLFNKDDEIISSEDLITYEEPLAETESLENYSANTTENNSTIESESLEDTDTVSEDSDSSNISNNISDENTSNSEITNDTTDTSSDTDKSTDSDSNLKTYEVNSNFNYSDTIASSEEVHLYLIDTDNMDKLTAIINFNESNVFSTIIYKYTDEGTFEEITASTNVFYDKMDNLSFIPDGGIYAVAVSASNPGDFLFRIQESNSHSNLEPNDNPFQANIATDQFSVTDSIDNNFDEDWICINVTQDCEYRITKSENNCSLDNLYIVDFNTGNITSITDASTDISLLRRTYYIVASGTISENDNSYSITMIPKDSIVSWVHINSITSRSGSSTANYSQGWKYQVKNSMVVSGTAYNESNQVVKNGLVFVCLQTYSGNLCYQAVTTDESGAFTANVTLKASSGSQSYYNSSSCIKYYYDVASIIIMNYNYETVTSNISSVYHFSSSNYVAPNVTSIDISEITSPDNGSNSRINYVYGNFWRVCNSMTVKGTAYDSNGRTVRSGKITMAVQTELNNEVFKASTTTNSDGTFSITLNIGPAVGKHTFCASRSTHYFDIIPMVFVNASGNSISCSDQLLYHYAYGSLY